MKYWIRTAVICLLICLTVPTWSVLAAPDVGSKLTVSTNQSRVFNFSGLQRAAIANPEIADVLVVSSYELLLVGKMSGQTTLIVWSDMGRQTYNVEVGSNDTAIANEIKKILGYPDIRVTKVGKTVILEGSVNDQYQRIRAEKLAGAYADKVVNLLEITRPIQVKIEARVIEIDRKKSSELGIKLFSETGTASSLGIFFAGQSTGINQQAISGSFGYSNINGQIGLMVQNGYARILSQPNMVTLSGEKANILVGGQIPIPVSVQGGQIGIEWKEYGIKLEIAPEVSLDGLITTRVKAEVSALDYNSTHQIKLGANMSIPPLTMRKAETVIALSSGQTMAIGGLISSENSKDITKIPILGDIPVIGQLFRSTSFTKGETELIIFMTPTIVDAKDYVPGASTDMKDFINQNPVGGSPNVQQNKGANR